MKWVISFFLLCSSVCVQASPDWSVVFTPQVGVDVKISASKGVVTYSSDAPGKLDSSDILLEEGVVANLKIFDFNFDGALDFSLWNLDQGKGVHVIHRVFLFDKKKKVFFEVTPRCGDGFLNLRVSLREKSLISTYYQGNKPVLCVTRLVK